MEKSSSQKALKIVAIIMIVFAILSIVGGLFMAVGGGVLGSAAIDAADDNAAAMGGVAMIGGVMLAFGGIVNLVIGLFGLRGANTPQKIGVFFVLSIIGVVLSAFSFMSTITSGIADITSIIGGLVGLALPIACVLLAYNIKKENKR